MAFISDRTVALVEGIAAEAERVETPCGDGAMVWRCWGGGPPLVLLHGGYGSWTHWVRNVLPLSRQFTVIAPDLPGLGELATPPEPQTAEGLAAIIVAGLDIVLSRRRIANWAALHLAGFSFGGVIGGSVAVHSAIGWRASRWSARTGSGLSARRRRCGGSRRALMKPRNSPPTATISAS